MQSFQGNSDQYDLISFLELLFLSLTICLSTGFSFE